MIEPLTKFDPLTTKVGEFALDVPATALEGVTELTIGPLMVKVCGFEETRPAESVTVNVAPPAVVNWVLGMVTVIELDVLPGLIARGVALPPLNDQLTTGADVEKLLPDRVVTTEED